MVIATCERAISQREIVGGSVQQLSLFFRDIEAQMIGDLARRAHLEGRSFDGWPTFSVVQDDNLWSKLIRYRAQVDTL